MTTSLFREFAVWKVQMKDCMEGASYSVVLQLFNVEATRLDFDGCTKLQAHVLQRALSFVTLLSTNWEALEGKAKSALPEEWQQWQYTLDNNFFENDYIYCEYYWQYVVAKATSWEWNEHIFTF